MTSSPAQTIEQFARHANDGDLDAAMTLYEPDAAFLPDPGSTVTGVDAIRQALAGFFALDGTLTGEVQRVVEAGEIALVINAWELKGTAPDGGEVHLSGRSADVVRRQPDGRWLLLIDNPWG